MARCQKLARISDHVLDHKVKRAWAAIYERGKGVKSTAVEDQFASESYLPTTVRNLFHSYFARNTLHS